MSVEHHTRPEANASWTEQVWFRPDDKIALSGVTATIQVGDLYRRVVLSPVSNSRMPRLDLSE